MEEKDMEMLDKAVEAKDDLRQRSGYVEYELKKPFEWTGETYQKLVFDFENLTGADMEAVDDELAVSGVSIIWPVQSRKYQKMLAARAAHIPSDVIEHLPMADYNAITGFARNFLIATG